MSDIYFGATTSSYKQLSNLCPSGKFSVECRYQAIKFKGDTRDRFLGLESLSEDQLLKVYYELSGKHQDKKNFWIRSPGIRMNPIFFSGIVFKMLGSLPRMKGSARKKRELVLARLLGYESTAQIMYAAELPDTQKIDIMREIQRERFEQSPSLKQLLLSTSGHPLHEAAFRGKTNLWNWNPKKPGGGDAMGKILVELREQLIKH